MTTFGFQLYSARNFPPLSDVLRLVAQKKRLLQRLVSSCLWRPPHS